MYGILRHQGHHLNAKVWHCTSLSQIAQCTETQTSQVPVHTYNLQSEHVYVGYATLRKL